MGVHDCTQKVCRQTIAQANTYTVVLRMYCCPEARTMMYTVNMNRANSLYVRHQQNEVPPRATPKQEYCQQEELDTHYRPHHPYSAKKSGMTHPSYPQSRILPRSLASHTLSTPRGVFCTGFSCYTLLSPTDGFSSHVCATTPHLYPQSCLPL